MRYLEVLTCFIQVGIVMTCPMSLVSIRAMYEIDPHQIFQVMEF